ncbi:MAG: ABC transporter ATP-binding protein [Sphaerochaetaceae bacterium]|nr:ABC transporter ATP-binding protein [Sphaerochaetaceae bacterium]
MKDIGTNDILLTVENLQTHLFTKRGVLKAVDGVSFHLRKNETLGIVGESGSGKSMTALSLVQLLPRPVGKIVGGSIRLDGDELVTKTEREMSQVRGKKISMILQDPQSSLNPVFTVGSQVMEAFKCNSCGRRTDKELQNDVEKALQNVQIADPHRRVKDYPHQMSGGMKQRVVGAIAISCEPLVLIADEPTTALDVTIQAQYLRLLNQIKKSSNLSIIFITHDFGVVAQMCDRVAVMYAGRIVETGLVKEFFENPAHPYTEALIQSIPCLDRKDERLLAIEGQPPNLWNLPEGCRFAPRCPHVMDICRKEYPPTKTISDQDEDEHTYACWLERGVDCEK